MYQKHIFQEDTQSIKVVDQNGQPVLDENGNEQFETVVVATATKARVADIREEIVNKASVRVQCYNDEDVLVPEFDTWITTEVPGSLLLMFRRVVAQTAPQNEVDMIHEFVLNSPEGNAIFPLVENPNIPQLDLFKTALFQDPDLPITAKNNLIIRYPLLDAYTFTQPALVTAAWSVMKASGEAWMTPAVIERVESFATQYNIPLV